MQLMLLPAPCTDDDDIKSLFVIGARTSGNSWPYIVPTFLLSGHEEL
jgi:hypothetical protein